MENRDLNEIQNIYKYRYFDCNNYHIKTILDNEFYFATRKQLNDPFDLSLKPEYESSTKEDIMKYLAYIIQNKNLSELDDFKELCNVYNIIKEKSIEELHQRLHRNYDDNMDKYRICSFSINTWENILMWSHYSDSHKGFCIGIDWQKLSTFLWENYRKDIVPAIVQYGKEMKTINMFLEGNFKEMFDLNFSYKYNIWEYENEMRLLMVKPTKNLLIIPDEFIKEVYLGLNVKPANKDRMINILNRKEIKPKLYQIIQKKGSFEFDREEIEY